MIRDRKIAHDDAISSFRVAVKRVVLFGGLIVLRCGEGALDGPGAAIGCVMRPVWIVFTILDYRPSSPKWATAQPTIPAPPP